MVDVEKKKMIVLVTGGAGFIGSHLCGRLINEGHRVISLDNYFAGSKDNHIALVEYREGHTKDIEQHIPETPDIVYHLGEYSRVEQSVLEPDIVHDLNTVGTASVVNFWRAKKCKLVYAGSSTKFGDGGMARNTSPYAMTKATNTELIKKVGDAEGLPYAITYFYNVFGPGERTGVYGTVVESFKQMYLRGTPLTVISPGTQKRNFTHVYDIVDGLLLVGQKGNGDEFGLGNNRAYSILEVAELFHADIIMMPERTGNRMDSTLDTSKTRALGWKAERSLEDHIHSFVKEHIRGVTLEKRVLVFSTTFYPVTGPAENALIDLVASMPDVQFDIITTLFAPHARETKLTINNVSVHRLGWGRAFDKYLLPFLGYMRARKLQKKHSYLFAWALMASYAGFAGIFVRRTTKLPLLITLADQNLSQLSAMKKIFLQLVLTDADQVYGGDVVQEGRARAVAKRENFRRSLGDGDAFANTLRFAYSGFLKKYIDKK